MAVVVTMTLVSEAMSKMVSTVMGSAGVGVPWGRVRRRGAEAVGLLEDDLAVVADEEDGSGELVGGDGVR